MGVAGGGRRDIAGKEHAPRDAKLVAQRLELGPQRPFAIDHQPCRPMSEERGEGAEQRRLVLHRREPAGGDDDGPFAERRDAVGDRRHRQDGEIGRHGIVDDDHPVRRRTTGDEIVAHALRDCDQPPRPPHDHA